MKQGVSLTFKGKNKAHSSGNCNDTIDIFQNMNKKQKYAIYACSVIYRETIKIK